MKEQLGEFVRSVYNTVPMYYRMKEKNNVDIEHCLENGKWESLPVVDKNLVVSEGESSLSPSAIPLLLRGKLISSRTSGSTGKYMEIYWTEDDYKKSMLPLWYYRNRYYGIKPQDKLCFFYTIHQTGGEEEAFFYHKNSLGFSKSNLNMEQLAVIYEKMGEYHPKWLMLQPSMAVLLCECMDRYHLEPIGSIEYIEFSGEILTEYVRKMTMEHFKCQIANQYGANEFNSIAYECPKGHMHMVGTNVYVEEGKEENELYITTLTNSAMPLIRYRIGDRGRIRQEIKCSCGNGNPVLELLSGRANDFIICENGEKKSPYALVRGIESINYEMEGMVKQFQIEQNDISSFTIRLAVDKEDELYDERYIAERFRKSVVDEELKEAEFRSIK